MHHVILKALEAPLHQIAANAGLEGAVIINKVRESEVGVGFDAYNEEICKHGRSRNPGSCKSDKKCTAECNQCCIHFPDN